MNTKTRTLELVNGDMQMCDNTRVESRECVNVASVVPGNNTTTNSSMQGNRDTWKHGENRRRKNKKRKRGRNNRRKKGRRRKNYTDLFNESKPECMYEPAVWSDCDPDTGLQTTTQTLNVNSDVEKCEKVIYSQSD